MQINLQSLYADYPFIGPCDADRAVLANIADARIVYVLPAADRPAAACNGTDLLVTMTSVSGTSATFSISIPGYGVLASASVPVYADMGSVATDSFVVVHSLPGSVCLLQEPAVLNPGCVMLYQAAPKLYFQNRPSFHRDPDESDSSSGFLQVPADAVFAGGHNVSTVADSNGITLASGAVMGLGPYVDELPFADTEGKAIVYGQGARSVNGLTGDITVTGSGTSIGVATDLLPGAPGQPDTLRIIFKDSAAL